MRAIALVLTCVLMACAPEDSVTSQQDAECPDGCIILSSSRDGLRCSADDPDCCEVNDPYCADGEEPDVDPCTPSGFLGKSFAQAETSMQQCYGQWRYKTDTVVSYCPSVPDAWTCPVPPLEFVLGEGNIVAYTGTYVRA